MISTWLSAHFAIRENWREVRIFSSSYPESKSAKTLRRLPASETLRWRRFWIARWNGSKFNDRLVLEQDACQ